MNTVAPSRVFLSLLFVLIAAATARSAEPDVNTIPKLEITPSPLKLGPGETGEVIVIAHNSRKETLVDAALSAVAGRGITATISGPTQEVPPGAGVAWRIHVARAVDTNDGGLVVFRLDFRDQSNDKNKPLAPWSIASSLEVQDRPAPTIDRILETRVESTLRLLQEHRPGIVYVIVKNKGAVPLTLLKIDPQKPPYVKLNEAKDKSGNLLFPKTYTNIDLAPLQERAFAFLVEADNAVPSGGKGLLVFEVQAAWMDAGLQRSASTIAKQEFEVGVLGESELQPLLTTIGVPTFFLAPGFLIVMALVSLWNLSSSNRLPLDLKKPEFWSIAILLSMLAAIAYPLIPPHRNYLDGYGLTDVFRVWLGSFAVALVLWAFAIGGRWIWNTYARWQLVRHTFSIHDSEVEVLRKLARNGISIRREQVHYRRPGASAGESPYQCVELSRTADGKMWIAPFIVYGWETNADQQAKTEFENALTAERIDGGALADLIDRLRRRGLKVRWAVSRAMSTPLSVAETNVAAAGADPRELVIPAGTEPPEIATTAAIEPGALVGSPPR
jgi:hypothetical protein